MWVAAGLYIFDIRGDLDRVTLEESLIAKFEPRFAAIERQLDRFDDMATKDDIERVLAELRETREEAARDRRSISERVSALEGAK